MPTRYGGRTDRLSGLLAGRKALVTGGSRGIGAAIANRLCAEGAAVTVTGTRPGHEPSNGCAYYAVDFADDAATEQFSAELAGWDLDILVNNAGTNAIAPFEEIPSADFDRIQQINLKAPFLLCRAVLPAMRRKGWGRIVNVTSIFGKVSKEFRGAYSASKFGLDGMTAALAAEVARDGVLANCVAPGVIDTELTRDILGEAGVAALAGQIPMRRLGTPDEVARLVVWLAGPENTYVTGQNIAVDGGFTRV